MPHFGKRSKKHLNTCHPKLQVVMNAVIKKIDIAITCGYRGKRAQHIAFLDKHSTVDWPNSYHNTTPSLAVDFVPWFSESPHVRWNDLQAFKDVIKIIKQESKKLKVDIISGGDWVSFKDYPHIQLKRSEL